MDPDDYEVLRQFITAYRSTCILNESHKVRPGEWVGQLQRADNPMLPVRGVACVHCIKGMRRVASYS